jgi:hypothetical protein
MRLLLIMIAACAVASILSYLASRNAVRATARITALLACLFAPIMIYTIWFALLPNDGDGFWVWWMTGLVMLSPVIAGWTVGTLSGGLVAAKARSLSAEP